MNNFHAGWHLIYTKPRHEKRVHARLTELNMTSFLPTRKVLRRWNDRNKYIDEPLFPSYVFIHLTNSKSFYTGIDIEGSLYYVRTGKEIARVQDSVVESIKMLVCQEKQIEVFDGHFYEGRKLVVREGALTGLSCEAVKFNNKQMLLVRVDLLRRNLLIELPVEYLIAE